MELILITICLVSIGWGLYSPVAHPSGQHSSVSELACQIGRPPVDDPTSSKGSSLLMVGIFLLSSFYF